MNIPDAAFLFFSHIYNRFSRQSYNQLRDEAGHLGDVFWLQHSDDNVAPNPSINFFNVTNGDIADLGYPLISNHFFPEHVHYPTLLFHKAHPNYDYYWVIEYDVCFSGSWEYFFKAFEGNESDFLSTNVKPHHLHPEWYNWETLHHPQTSIPLSERIRSFNPIHRLSSEALDFLHKSHADGWQGHYEVLIPTLLNRRGFVIEDIGGRGPFVPEERRDLFYTSKRIDSPGINGGTMRYRPPFWRAGSEPNKLYHPVKPPLSLVKKKLQHTKQRLRNTAASVLKPFIRK